MATATRQSGLFVAEDWKVIYRAFTEVNFSAYDFDTIRASMVDYIRINFPEDFNDWVESSEFISIIELLAYLGQSLAFRVDLNTRENFLDTAERRESVLKLARMISFNASRNIAANGLLKVEQISTTQPVTDSNGTNLANRTIRWNDANNPDWFEQFVLVLNAVFISTAPFGKPVKDGTVSGIKTQLYTLNNDSSANRAFPFSAVINNETLGFEIVNPDFTTNEFFFERDPDPTDPLNIIYRNDGEGNASTNTGFFLYFKQGSLIKEDFLIDVPIENRILNISGTNINNSDVFVQEIDESGFIINKWEKVPSVTGSNIIFNSVEKDIRNIFSVITQPDDKIDIKFADGRYGNVPVGIFRTWYRESANKRYTIKPENMRNNRLDIPYKSSIDNSTFFVSLTFSLQEQVSNSAPTQQTENIKQIAQQGFYVQNRMVNGEDYNVFPLRNPEAAKIKAVNRIYSGFNRYIDINDPTGKTQNVNLFGEDGLLYFDINNTLEELALVDGISDLSDDTIINQIILPLVTKIERKHFFYFNYPRFEPTEAIVAAIAGVTGDAVVLGVQVNTDALPQSIIIDGNTVVLTAGSSTQIDLQSIVDDINGAAITNVTADIDNDRLNIEKTGGGSLILEDIGIVFADFGITAAPTTYPARVYGTYWRSATNAVNSSTGRFFTDVDQQNYVSEAPIKIGENATPATPEFHMGEGSLVKFNKAGWVSIVSIIGDGDTILTNGDGSVGLSESVDEEDYVELIIMRLKTQFSDIEHASIKSQLSQHNTFGIRYDVTTETWIVVTGDNIADIDTDFSFDDAGSELGLPLDSSWLIRADFSPTNWRFTSRGMDYIYESDIDMRFYFSENNNIIDPNTGRSVSDFVKTLKINPQFEADLLTTPDSVIFNEITPCDGLGIDYSFNIESVFTESDGYIDPRRIKITYPDTDEDGIPDDPTLFEIITKITGFGDGTDDADNTINLPLIDNTLDASELYWESFTNSDGFIEFRPSDAVASAYNVDPGDLLEPTPASSSNKPSLFDAAILQGDVIYFRDTEDFYQSVIGEGLDEFVLVTGLYLYKRGRNSLYFQWKHYSAIQNRIDPAITNVIDIYVMTIAYDTEIRKWIDVGSTADTRPTPQTNEDLSNLFSEEVQNKMISDEISWHPIKYKLLFGDQADESLRARFKVTKIDGTSSSDGQIKSDIISTMNEYFGINNFDFGETFYYTELSAFIHQRLATQISSIVLVPLDAEQKFGDLFQVRSAANEVFISSAKVSDIQIVTSFNDNILRIGK